jgi:hypothetical protein
MICKALRKLATLKASAHEKSIIKILLVMLLRRRRETQKEKQKVSNDQQQQVSPSSTLLSSNLFWLSASLTPPEQTWEDVLQLQSHLYSWTPDMLSEWKKIQVFAIKIFEESGLLDDQFFKMEDCKDGGGDAGRAVLHLISKIESNGFGVWVSGKNDDSDAVCVGRAVFPLASFFNVRTSCRENLLRQLILSQ